MQKLTQWLKIALPLVMLLALAPAGSVLAANSNSSSDTQTSPSQQPNITEAYTSDQPLQRGMIVGLDPNDSSKVNALSSDRINQMQGVVVSANAAPVTIGNGNTNTNQIYVATLGRYDVLVSDQNGSISPGDYITISSLSGIGMNANNTNQLVVGKAVTGFDGSKEVLSNATLKNSAGPDQKVNIGLISVDLGIAHNPIAASSNQIFGFVFLQKVVKDLTGKSASPPRIYAAVGIFFIIALIAAAVLYSGIRGGMIATGRNPLAKATIGRNLFEVVLAAVVIFVIGLGAIYLVLKL